jgi:hypothetical protein
MFCENRPNPCLCLPVLVIPEVRLRDARVCCMGDPRVVPVNCGCGKYMVWQEVCLGLPVELGVNACPGRPRIECNRPWRDC